jgi:hypothetical protein
MGNFCEKFGLPPIAPSRKIGKNMIKFSERNLLHITIVIRKENSISLQRIFLKNPKQKILNLKNIFQKENALIVENQDILLISVQNLPKKLNKKLML